MEGNADEVESNLIDGERYQAFWAWAADWNRRSDSAAEKKWRKRKRKPNPYSVVRKRSEVVTRLSLAEMVVESRSRIQEEKDRGADEAEEW